ncbi:13114_t:CDS:2, partial [Entrophospora sp. SA101]
TDASNFALRAILAQVDDHGDEKVITYTGRKELFNHATLCQQLFLDSLLEEDTIFILQELNSDRVMLSELEFNTGSLTENILVLN